MRKLIREHYKLMDKIPCDLKAKNKPTMEFEVDFPDKMDIIDDCFQELLSSNLVEIWRKRVTVHSRSHQMGRDLYNLHVLFDLLVPGR